MYLGVLFTFLSPHKEVKYTELELCRKAVVAHGYPPSPQSKYVVNFPVFPPECPRRQEDFQNVQQRFFVRAIIFFGLVLVILISSVTNRYRLFSAVTLCDPNPCKNGATCVAAAGRYRCICPQGKSGPDCEESK